MIGRTVPLRGIEVLFDYTARRGKPQQIVDGNSVAAPSLRPAIRVVGPTHGLALPPLRDAPTCETGATNCAGRIFGVSFF
jgi:hypothetical protein